MAFNNPVFEDNYTRPTRQNARNASKEATVQDKYKVNKEPESADIYEEIPADRDSKYQTLKSIGPEHGYATLGNNLEANRLSYQTVGRLSNVEHTYATLGNGGERTFGDNAVGYDDPPPYDTIKVNYIDVKPQKGSFVKSLACKVLIVVLLCIAVLIGGVIIGLFISGKLDDDETHTTTQTTGEVTRTPTILDMGQGSTGKSSQTAGTVKSTKATPEFSSPTLKSKTTPEFSSSTMKSTTTTSELSSSTIKSTTTTPKFLTTVTTQRSTASLPTDPGVPILVSYGTWSIWPAWSDCSTTCGEGNQKRSRQCNKRTNSDLDCPGNDAETRQCNLGNCPKCDRKCIGSLIQEDCLSCHCVTSPTRHFRVVNTQTTPLEGASVAKKDVAHTILATTTGDGTVEIKNSCVGDMYIVKKDRFVDATVKVSNQTDYVVRMEALERLEMKEHPKDTVALVGDNRTLSCLASGKPQPNKYEWFKNGIPLDSKVYTANANVLHLREVVKQDGGMYSCMATSDYGVALSKSALLIVRDSGDDFCETTPKDYMKALPKDCPQSGSVFHYNVRRCANNACTKNPQTGDASYCCGPTKQEKKQITCYGYHLDVVEVLECGCIICNKANIGTTVTTKSMQVTFSGRAFDLSDPTTALRFGKVYLNGENVGSTAFDGSFSFVVPKDNLRVVLTLSEDLLTRGFINTTKVFYIPAGFTGTFYRDFPMMRVGNVEKLSPSIQNTLTLAKTGTQSPLAEVVIPPNVFFKENGDQYTGEVKAGVRFIDPRNTTNYENIVGDLTYVDENGQVGGLQTFGMFNLDFKDTEGGQLGIQGVVEMAINAEFLGASDPAMMTTDVKLWSLNSNTGRWELEGTLTRGTAVNGRRKKRSQSNYDTTFFIGNVTITDRYWFNFDNDELNYCYVKMKTYTDASLNTELPWNADTEATVIAMDSTQTGQWAQVTTGSMSYDGFTGAASDGDCVLTVCGSDKFTGYLMVDDPDGPFRGSSTLGGQSTSPAGAVQLTTTPLGVGDNALNYDRVINTTVSPLTSNGPIYHAGNSMCYNQSSTFCSYCFTVEWMPTCILCDSWSCQYPATVSYANCIAANSTSIPHYRFFKDSKLYEYTVCETYFDCENSPDLYPLIWYPPLGNAWAWYVKVKVEVIKQEYIYDTIKQQHVLRNTTLPDESVVRAVSYGGTHPKTDGKIFGIREDTTSQHTTCLEFKGSGDIILNENGNFQQGTDETVVDIKVDGTNCRIASVLPGLKDYEHSHSGLFGFKLPDGSIRGGDSTGIYFNDDANPDTAEKVAKARCNCADIQHGSPLCPDHQPDEGVGIKIICSPPSS